MVSFTVETPDQEDESTEEPIPILDEDGNPNEELTNESPDNSEPEIPDGLIVMGLEEAIEDYAEWCIDNLDELSDVDLTDVPIVVSRNLKRTAGKVRHDRNKDSLKVKFAYNAYQEWDEAEFKSTIRHELIHVWQIQELGEGNHGPSFKKKADKLDCSVYCDRFTDYKYELTCKNCDSLVGGRYKKSKIVKQPETYNSKCCGADLEVEKVK